jgi:hypothetical protein
MVVVDIHRILWCDMDALLVLSSGNAKVTVEVEVVLTL